MDKDDIAELEECSSNRNKAFLAFADKIVTLSAASLTLTVTFRTAITNGGVNYKWLLITCWSGFAVAVVLGTFLHLLLALFYGKRARDITMNIAETDAGRLFPILFLCMTIGFIVGVSTLTAFAAFNLD
jgi:hypothetical protein